MVWRRTNLADALRTWTAQPAPVELPRGHLPALDAIRGLAIVLVTLYRFGGGDHGPGSAIDAGWLVGLGSRGVDLFFVLSGFLITGILYDAKGKSGYFRNFYIRRSLRIFPLYYGVLAAVVILVPLFKPSWGSAFQPAIDQQAWLWLYGANVVQSVRNAWCLGPLNHFWSLAVEEHFYLAWPLVIFCTSRTSAMRVCLALAAFSTLGRVCWLAGGGGDVAVQVFTPLRMEGLALGGWVALAARGELGLAWLLRWSRTLALAAGLGALAIAVMDKRLLGLPETLWSVFFAATLVCVVAARQEGWLHRFGQSRVFRFFGKYSYAMYVFQNLLIPILAGLISAPALAAATGNAYFGQTIYCAIMFALTTLVALASWNLFEKHFLKLKDRFAVEASKQPGPNLVPE